MQYVGVITNVNDLVQDTTGGLTMKILIIEQNWTALNMFDVRKYIFWVEKLCDLLHVRIYANSGFHWIKTASTLVTKFSIRLTQYLINWIRVDWINRHYFLSIIEISIILYARWKKFHRISEILITWKELPLLNDFDV